MVAVCERVGALPFPDCPLPESYNDQADLAAPYLPIWLKETKKCGGVAKPVDVTSIFSFLKLKIFEYFASPSRDIPACRCQLAGGAPYGEMQAVHVGLAAHWRCAAAEDEFLSTSHSATSAMESKWQSLQPWRQVLRDCKALHDSLDVVDSRDFRASHLPVQASIRCWPALPKGYELLGGRCTIPVPFPADAAIRRDRVKLQRVREAMELFNVLATVSRAAFLELLSECVVVADNFDDLFTPDYIFVLPVWECYLVGRLDSEDEVTKGGVVTWGALFGCPEDPMEYSPEFRAAMQRLKEMRVQVNSMLGDFMGRHVSAEWRDPCNVVEWTAEHLAIPTRGVQTMTSETTSPAMIDSVMCELSVLMGAQAPASVQLCAVMETTNLLKTWEYSPPNSLPLSVETMRPVFSAPGVLQLTTALANMNLASLRLNLDEGIESIEPGKGLANASALLTALVCGSHIHQSAKDVNAAASFPYRGQITDFEVTLGGNSTIPAAGLCSAIVGSSLIRSLTLNMGTLSDRNPVLNQIRWGWLVYALWSGVSRSTIQCAKLTNIHLSRATVNAIADALRHSYPPSNRYQGNSEEPSYGYFDIKAGAVLRPSALGPADNTTVVASQDWRCRARYNCGVNNDLEVVVPGFGLCTLVCSGDIIECAPDDTVRRQDVESRGIRSLSLEFFQIETPTLVGDLLALIGRSLRSLSMGIFWTGRRRCVMLKDVAAACPQLQELSLSNFDLVLSSHDKLRNWGVRKLSITGSEELTGVADHLKDPSCRMARELEELEITIPRGVRVSTNTIQALKSHHGDYLAITKDRLCLSAKAAMISVVDSNNCVKHSADKLIAVHRLDEILLGFIFRFAATPKRRIVRIN